MAVLERMPEWNPTGLATLMLYVTGQCNLRCAYCYEESRLSRRPPPMSREVALLALRYLGRHAAHGRLSLRFTGGEPLLNLDVVDYVVRAAPEALKGAGLSFEMTTNGTVDPGGLVRLLSGRDFRINLSLDAPPRRHDRRRRTAEGGGSFALVDRTLQALAAAGLSRRVIINCVLEPGDDPRAAWEWLREAGVGAVCFVPAFPGAMRPDPWGGPRGERLLEDMATGLCRVAHEFSHRLAQGEHPPAITNLVEVWRRMAAERRRPFFCGAGATSLTVGPDGAVYPCYRLVGDARFRLGHVEDEGPPPPAAEAFRARRPVEERRACRECDVRYLCGGGCYAVPTLYGAEPAEPYEPQCRLQRAQCRAAAEGYATLARTAPYALARLAAPEMLEAYRQAVDRTPRDQEGG